MNDGDKTKEQLLIELTTLRQRVATLEAAAEEHQQTEATSRESEAYYKILAENVTDVIWIRDLQLRPLYISPSVARVRGYSVEEAMSQTPAEALTPASCQVAQQALSQALARVQAGQDEPDRFTVVELEILRKDGSTFWSETRVTFIRDDAGQPMGLVGIQHDITEHKQAEETLRQSEVRYRTLVEASIQGIAIISRDGRRLFANPSFLQMLGFESVDDYRRYPALNNVAPHERARVNTFLDAVWHGESMLSRYEYEVIRVDGTPIWLERQVTLIEWDDEPAMLSTVIDITERKRLESQLRQAQKMEAVGTLAGGIAHDFNNVLGAIFIHTEVAKTRIQPNSAVQGNLQNVLLAASRAKDLVQQILTFSRQIESQRQPVRLTAVIQETLTLLSASLPTTIEIRQSLPKESAMILADPTQLHRIVLNLCINAEHAMRETGGLLDINVDQVEIDDVFTRSHPDLQPGSHVRLMIRDSGHGMTPEVMERIFDPYFTTKSTGEGSGMGLAMVHGIVSSYGGAITVESTPSTGATFILYFPCIQEPVGESPQTQDAIPPGAGCIMVVDDEPMLAMGMKALLQQFGYEVVPYTKSQEALAAFSAQPERFDLVITDQTMPQMTGEQLARELRAHRPNIPIILCTGFSHTINAKSAKEQGIDAYCLKPVSVQELTTTIQHVLKQRSVVDDAAVNFR